MECILINSPDALYSKHYVSDPKIPLGLLYIASYLRYHGAEVMIIDCHTDTYTPDKLVKIIKKHQPLLVGLNITTPNSRVVYRIAEKIKKESSSAVIIGGPHASCFPTDVFKNAPHIDGIVMGEGEEAVLKVLYKLPEVESFSGFYTRSGFDSPSTAICSAPRIINLDSLPMPAYDLISMKKYTAVSPELYVTSSRGCRYNCAFCCSRAVFGSQVVFRNLENVLEEMSLLKARYGINKFYFYDDNILHWRDLKVFCDKLSNLNIRWTAQANINNLHLGMVPLLSLSGCYRLSFGLESGSLAIQKYIGKVIKPDAAKKISTLLEFGISSRAFFIIGFPSETIHDIAETAKYIIELRNSGLSDIAIFPARPFPGTRLFQDCISIYGSARPEDLFEFQYIEDHWHETDVLIKAKLQRYNTIPSFQINKYFNSCQIRLMIKALYVVFYNYTQYDRMTHHELARYLHNCMY